MTLPSPSVNWGPVAGDPPLEPPTALGALLRMRGISKAFPGVHALRGIDLHLAAGEVLGLVGENGAGKSTLVRILAGVFPPDSGVIWLHGERRAIPDPVTAQQAGIAVMHQEFNLVPSLTVRENLFLGHEPTRSGLLRVKEEISQARRLFARVGFELDPEARCRDLTVAQQQVVEICRALSRQARLMVMDEPSAALTGLEVRRLLAMVRELRSQGIGIIYISHRLEEVLAVADRITVLRDGQHVATAPAAGVTRAQLIEWMVGRKLELEFPPRQVSLGEDCLVVRHLCRGAKVRGVSFSIRRGEVLGLTGLVGAGRTETARLLFGADRRTSGAITLDGQPLSLRHPREAIRAGIALLTEDRKHQGLILGQSARLNFGLPNLPCLSRWGLLRQRRERAAFATHVQALGIKLPHLDQLARHLSGGNQQKVVLAKWLERNCRVLMFDEPTRGIDVGAKYDVYVLINRLAAQGKAILMISSELPEILGMSDRVLVMRRGEIAGEVTAPRSAKPEDVLGLAVG